MISSTLLIQKLERISFLVLGDFEDVGKERAYRIVLFGDAMVFLFGSVVGFLNTNTTSGMVDRLLSLSALSLTCFALSVFIDISAKKKRIRKLLSMMENKDDTGQRYVLRRANTLVKDTLITRLLTVIIAIALPLGQMLLQSLQNEPIDEKYSLILPFWLSCGDNNDNGILSTLKTICFPVRTNLHMLAMNAILIPIGSLMAAYIVAAIVLFSITIYEISAHVDIFKSMIRDLSDRMDAQYDLKSIQLSSDDQYRKKLQHSDREIVDLIDERFISVIKYHQFLHRCINGVVDTWTTYSEIFVIYQFASMSMMVFSVWMETGNAVTMAFRVFGLILFNSIIFSMICFYGFFVSETNEVLFEELRIIPWYQRSAKFRKTYGIMLSLTRPSIRIKVLGLYEVGLCTIQSAIRSTYSVLNLMNAMQTK